MKILFVATEAYPFIRTGGLGDVMGALPKHLSNFNNDIRVIIPNYSNIKAEYKEKFTYVKNFIVKVGWRNQYCGIKEFKENNVTYYFIDNEYYFKRDNIYGYFDDGERFAFFDRAVLDSLEQINWMPDIIHCNDWQCGMIPVLQNLEYKFKNFYSNIKTVYAIHNLLFQGIFSPEVLGELFSYDLEQYNNGILKMNNNISFMKGGIHYADKIVTVSDTYAKEIQSSYYGENLDGLLRYRNSDLIGILNGIDYDEYNPKNDRFISENFDINSIKDKKENKLALQKELNLDIDEDIPMIAVISRLTNQKGIDLIKNVEEQILNRNVQLVILGTGDKDYEYHFKYLESKYKGKVSVNILFDTPLSHRIYAGADMFLMPSLFEPCGLGQLIALRYGTIPIVRETGGLKDTIQAYNKYTKVGNGFSFANYSSKELIDTIFRALELYEDKKSWIRLVKQAILSNNSWGKSVNKYIELYKDVLGINGGNEFMERKEMIGMILAGGQGSRLGVLTERLAKPAVPYGGKYRLIDFPLSNCVNSGVNTVGVVTQYKPNAIYQHIGTGEAWDLKRIDEAGVSFLPPYTEDDKDNCYKGTADAIYQNIPYIDSYDPEYVLILSGDHIYKMNYDKMLKEHKANNADATISVIEVSLEEASRFGIMNTRADGSIESFEEKPEKPKSKTASMGVYIFNWATLKEYLIEDNADELSSNDFGKNIIPKMLEDNKRMFAFNFKGYWKDVGTVESLWEANMDLLDPECELNLFDEKWQINSANMSQRDKCQIGITANIMNSILGDECKIDGTVENSILSSNVEIGKGAVVINSVILGKTIIESNVVIENAIIGGRSIIREGTIVYKANEIASIGRKKDVKKDVVLNIEDEEIEAKSILDDGVLVV